MTPTPTPTPTPATTPAANGRVVALAHHAARAVLEGVLDRHGLTFHQNVLFRAVVVGGSVDSIPVGPGSVTTGSVTTGSIGRDELVADVAGSLKTDETLVRGVVEEAAAAGLLEQDPADASRVRLTAAGLERYERAAAETAEVSARLYDGIPPEDLAVAGRVLTLVTDRANAELDRA
ncbi:MarR family transcriptional regulator [Kitasatospora sp. NPDC004745]|uniref:MarR family winged helix-turn-helix transcriptional regulator n=1 Tax=unclassified Kitasatospora TaxID=2633591 RepID=UPI00340B452B